mgnify:FL=1
MEMNNYQSLALYDTKIKSGMTLEDEEPYVITTDINGEDIWSDSDAEYFDTDEGYLFIDDSIRGIKDSEIFEYLNSIYIVVDVEDIREREW